MRKNKIKEKDSISADHLSSSSTANDPVIRAKYRMSRHIQYDDGREDVDTPGGYAVNESEKASEHAVNDTGDRMWGYGNKTTKNINSSAK